MINTKTGTMFIKGEKVWPVMAEYSFTDQHHIVLFDGWEGFDASKLEEIRISSRVVKGVLNISLFIEDKVFTCAYINHRNIKSQIENNLGVATKMSVVFVDSNTGVIAHTFRFILSEIQVAYFEQRLMQQVKEQAGYGIGSCTSAIVNFPLLEPQVYLADEVITLTTSVCASHRI